MLELRARRHNIVYVKRTRELTLQMANKALFPVTKCNNIP